MKQNIPTAADECDCAWYDIPHLQKYRSGTAELPRRLHLLARFRPEILSADASATEEAAGVAGFAGAADFPGFPGFPGFPPRDGAAPFGAAGAEGLDILGVGISAAGAEEGIFGAEGEDLGAGSGSATFDIIDNFLKAGSDHKITIAETTSDEFSTPSERLPEGSLLTEELASVYEKQGLYARAIEIYRGLSLLNPEKSVYFAERIAELESAQAAGPGDGGGKKTP